MPAFDDLWDYNDPAATESKFRALLTGDFEPRGELMTQIARTLSLQKRFDEAHALLEEAKPLCDGPSRAYVRWLLEKGRTFNSSGDKPSARALFTSAYEEALKLEEHGLAVDAAHMVAIAESGEGVMRWNLVALELAAASTQPAARRWRKSIYNNLGWTHFDLGQLDEALNCFIASEAAARDIEDAESARIARWCQARTLREQGRPRGALDLLEPMLEEIASTGKEDKFVGDEIEACKLALARAAPIDLLPPSR